ncbi:hypothetical protein QO206_13315 [Leeuwenhoekiella aequorea]|uniref:hypothetical protein n=1 Tax=Leeuwenhoekiella aequorea TaxID=283736 RepID=UPI00352EFA77|tara:strand:+ start:22209 stop:22658 length:450 start_codon:yes stop_codon:yes gene_type:complete
MATSGMLDSVFNSLDETKRSLEDQALKIVAEIQEIIIDYNRERQLFDKGIDSKGSLLKAYKPFTIALKKQKGEVYNRTTLLDTEDFYKGFYLTAKNGTFEINSSDDKTPALKKKYGADIFGLIPDNEGKVNFEEIYPRLLEWIINNLHL